MPEPLPRGFDRSLKMFLGGIGKSSRIIAQRFKAEMPEGFGVIGSEQANLHEETVPMNQSLCFETIPSCATNFAAADFRDVFTGKKKRIKFILGRLS